MLIIVKTVQEHSFVSLDVIKCFFNCLHMVTLLSSKHF